MIGIQDKARIIIENVYPEIDCGRYPIKREVGTTLNVWADIFMEGHDVVRAVLRHRKAGENHWHEVHLAAEGNDRWHGSFALNSIGRHEYAILAWFDVFGTWQRDTRKKLNAGLNIDLELEEGRALLAQLKPKNAEQAERLRQAQHDLLGDDIANLVEEIEPRDFSTRSRILTVYADRPKAAFSAWYEIFPRSQGTDPSHSGTFNDCIGRLTDIRSMGFDVLYLTPIHPIGQKHRKGKNNALTAQEGDPGCPYAVADHKAVHPELGTLEDFRRLVEATKAHGMEIALDFAIQCAPDHPYVTEHPEWFMFRPDGTIKYAENPPKKYEDIVNVDFFCKNADALWEELRSIVLFWVEQGVRIFRVDNPHTKPFPFWEWLIRTVQDDYPDVIFLSEAFTRPKVMYLLAKAGFTQSYTYFTWRNTKQELIEYLTELTVHWPKDYFRPNFFTNTPDILPKALQNAGRSVFMTRFALAATLAGNYGIHSGYELCENIPVPGKEEYLDSEKYEFKPRDWNAPGNFKDFITRINRIRQENPAMHEWKNLRFYQADNDNILFYGKATDDRSNAVFVAVNLDPHTMQEAHIHLPLEQFGLSPATPYRLDDLLLDHSWHWTGMRQHLRLDPNTNPVAIFRFSQENT